MQYIFLFGRTPAISAAELGAVFSSEALDVKAVHYAPGWAIVHFSSTPDIHALQRQLAGTVKIAEVVGEGKDIDELLSVDLLIRHVVANPRMKFGISGYPADAAFGMRLKKLALTRKKELIQQGHAARVVTAKTPALSSAAVAKNKLLTHGAEFLVLQQGSTYTLAVTRTVQDFEGFAMRDEARIVLDAKSGMLPLQLARTMVNLVQAKPGSTILDPFCGTGTVLMEARDLGFHVIGSDISSKAIQDSEKNLGAQDSRTRWRVLHSDVAMLEKNLPEKHIQAIVTEPFLGPPQHRHVGEKAQEHFFEKLRKLYEDAFAVFTKILEANGRIVFVFPALAAGKTATLYPFLDDILLKHSFRIVQPLPPDAVPVYRSMLSRRNSLLYNPRDQHVVREIVLLEKKKGSAA